MLLGAHVSAEKGLDLAPERARSIGARALQLFTRNQRTWSARPVGPAEAEAFRRARAEAGILVAVSHASYLANPAAPARDVLNRTRRLLSEELDRCLALGLDLLVLHPGAALDSPRARARARVAETLAPLLDRAAPAGLAIALENTAGQGSLLGADFDELAELLGLLHGHPAARVCLDTAHAWGAGHDLRGRGLTRTLAALEKAVGPGRLAALHLNDTAVPLGSRKDRHACLGEGLLGLDPFKRLQRSRKLAALPGILETPGGMEGWKREIAALEGG